MPRRMYKFPKPQEFLRGVEAYRKNEKRDSIYKVASFLIEKLFSEDENRKNLSLIADAVGTLLLGWNSPFYRHGRPDFDLLEEVIDKYYQKFLMLRRKSLLNYNVSDYNQFFVPDCFSIRDMFLDFLEATKMKKGSSFAYSPVAAVKALHMLAPSFFPLWDDKIAQAYGCPLETPNTKIEIRERNADNYRVFMKIQKAFLVQVKAWDIPENLKTLKAIDEFNYSKYTKGWI